jgi:hypothetical protein
MRRIRRKVALKQLVVQIICFVRSLRRQIHALCWLPYIAGGFCDGSRTCHSGRFVNMSNEGEVTGVTSPPFSKGTLTSGDDSCTHNDLPPSSG